jgi:UDP-2,3-diacylglucosamine hydrolase
VTPPTPSRAVFVSDLHIRRADDAPGRHFRAFLRELDDDVAVFVLGDLFDWLYGQPGHIPAHLQPVIDALKARPRVLWLEGNHDMRVGRALGQSDIEVHDASVRRRVAGLRLELRHGDLVDPTERGYRLLRGFLRSPIMGGITRLMGPPLTQRIGELATTARHVQDGPLGEDGRRPKWLAAARAHASRAEGVDLCVLGHGHWLGWWAEGLVCLGDWVHYRSYLEVDEDGARLRVYEPDAVDSIVARGPVGALPW